MPECRNAGILSTARTGYTVGRERRTPCPTTSGGLSAVAFEQSAQALLTVNLGQRHNLVLQVAAIRLRPAPVLGLLERLVVQRLVRTIRAAIYHNILDFSARVLAIVGVEVPTGLTSSASQEYSE